MKICPTKIHPTQKPETISAVRSERPIKTTAKGSPTMSVVIRTPASPSADDAGTVRPDGVAEDKAPASSADDGRVRLGGMTPSLKDARIADHGRVRLGGMAPAI